MSGRLVGEVLKDGLEDLPQRRRRSARAVLVALAEDSRDGRVAWPSVARIAARSLLSDRQVVRVLNELVAAGRIVAEGREGGRARTTRWRILEAPATAGKGDTTASFDASERVTSGDGKGDIAVSPEPYEPESLYPTAAGAAVAQPLPAAPSLPGLGVGEDGALAIGGSSRAAGSNPRANGSNPRAIGANPRARRRAAADARRRREIEESMRSRRDDQEALDEQARSPEAIAARDAVRARFVAGGRGP